MSAMSHLKNEIVRLSTMIGAARARVAAGAIVDLTPLGSGIEALCRAVAVLPDTQGSDLKYDLAELGSRLDRLGADIRARMEATLTADSPTSIPQSGV